MTVAFPVPERKLKNPGRLLRRGAWLLLTAAICLLVLIRRTGTLRGAAYWILGCALVAPLLSLAYRDLMERRLHRHTEEKLLEDVKAFLETEEPVEVRKILSIAPIDDPPAPLCEEEEEVVVPLPATSFVSLCRSRHREPGEDLVVFDAIPVQTPVVYKADFFPVFAPVVLN